MPYRAFHDRTGERYGRLLIIGYVGVGNHSRVWKCQCDCGQVCHVAWKQIQQNHKTSCGCRWRETRSSYGGMAGHNRKINGASAFNQIFYSYQRSARKRQYSFTLTIEEFRALVENPCFYCGDSRSTRAPSVRGTNGDYFYTGIDRTDNTMGYDLGNVRPCCKQCNIAKGVLSEAKFLAWVHQVCAHLGRLNCEP
jgi:hypothetical protein